MSMNEIRALRHAVAPLSSGGMVLLLNTGAIITAEDTAMLQALHSRDPRGVLSHLDKLAEVGSGRFMEKFYVGYGHKSIGDCGTITIFIEGASMLAAKAIQDWQLYSGQECSTRYLDFSHQPFLNPVASNEVEDILSELRNFYVVSLDRVADSLYGIHARNPDENEAIYNKAIAARAFDIMRSFLPAGAMTNLSWHANLRQTADKLGYLRHHPLREVREIADAIEKVCREANPHSFSEKRYDMTEAYVDTYMRKAYYFDHEVEDFTLMHDGIDRTVLMQYKELLSSRPPKTELPKQLGEAGTMRFQMLLDFGSFRDIQRQRSLIQRMPLLSVNFGFHSWYLAQLPSDIKDSAEHLLWRLESIYHQYILKDNVEAMQYMVPMGYLVPLQFTGDLPALTYVAELRSTAFVHPTLQERAIQLAKILVEKFGSYGHILHVDPSLQDRFDVRRGTQDIHIKE